MGVLLLFLPVAVGGAVGAALPSRKRVTGLRGKVFRFILYALIVVAALVWIGFVLMSVESFTSKYP
jgi:uncharacterized membrane protein